MNAATCKQTQVVGSTRQGSASATSGHESVGSGYRTAARAIMEMSGQIRAAIAQLTCVAAKELSTASGRIDRGAAVCVHLEQAAQDLGRIEELARRLVR